MTQPMNHLALIIARLQAAQRNNETITHCHMRITQGGDSSLEWNVGQDGRPVTVATSKETTK